MMSNVQQEKSLIYEPVQHAANYQKEINHETMNIWQQESTETC